MPLPPALAARLAKRGLLKSPSADNEPVEEVIAEDYDDRHEPHSLIDTVSLGKTDRTTHALVSHDIDDEEFEDMETTDGLVYEALLCPNRSNSYHACTEYCRQRWGCKRFKPDTSVADRHERLLRRYPVPTGWCEVGDPETSRFYYWNVETDEVSWLPPQHPRAIVTFSTEKRMDLVVADTAPNEQYDSQGESDDEGSTDLDDENDDDHDFEEIERELKRKAQSDRDRGKDHRRGARRSMDESLDPMDPAAYSDVPRGGWATGLELRDSAKTGADVTASGPLFQQRPYPSPGAVLRMNKDKK